MVQSVPVHFPPGIFTLKTGLVVATGGTGTADVTVDPNANQVQFPQLAVGGADPSVPALDVVNDNNSPAGGTGIRVNAKTAGMFHGDVDVTGNLSISGSVTSNLHITGTLNCDGDHHVKGTMQVDKDIILTAGADCAEHFAIDGKADVDPGTVMIIDDSGLLRPCTLAYDKRVTGVVSGAGNYKPGLILGRNDIAEDHVPIALLGKVFCRVDCRYGAIKVGDMLTTSPTLGHAMKVNDTTQAFGAVIGKALGQQANGCGLLPILIALQ